MRTRDGQTIEGREPWLSAAVALLNESGCTVRQWRTSTTGTSYTRDDDWGIDVPEPRGPVSFATLAHEVAHQMLHRGLRQARWLEEWQAWEYALQAFERFGLPRVEEARRDAAKCLVYAAAKAQRRAKDPAGILDLIVAVYPSWVWEHEGVGDASSSGGSSRS